MINMKSAIKEKIVKEIEEIPEDKADKLYDVIHYFRLGLNLKQGKVDTKKKALSFFGIWRDIAPDENRVLKEINLRREKTFRKRIL